jgi:hypothetical protein
MGVRARYEGLDEHHEDLWYAAHTRTHYTVRASGKWAAACGQTPTDPHSG